MVEGERQDNHGHNEDERQAGINQQAHADGEQQTEGCADSHTENLLIGILKIVDIGRHARHQATCRKLVNIAERKGLDVAIHRLTKVRSETRRSIS